MSAARAAAAVAAVVASYGVTFALCAWAGARSQPAIFAALFAIVLARRASPHGFPAALVATGRMAGLALITAGVGWLFHLALWLGAVVFVTLLSLSVWLRQFGARARLAGALIALPLVALLVLPGAPAHARGGPLVDLALVAAAGVVALLCVSVMQRLVPLGVEPDTGDDASPGPANERRKPRAGLSAPARMALQLAVALGASFVVGNVLFHGHWGWSVLTAYIVCAGARGRGDALYKAVLRVGGAMAGSVIAVAVAYAWAPSGLAEAGTIVVALFLGLWLRRRNYAYWAAAMTLIFALLARTSDPLAIGALGARLEAILAGAVCAVAAAWFVLPITSEAVIRRRLADALLALDDLVAHVGVAEDDHVALARIARFEHHIDELERVAPPVRWHRRLVGARARPEHPAQWIDLAHGLRSHARVVASHRDRRAVRKAIGASRRAIADYGSRAAAEHATVPVTDALAALHETLATGHEPCHDRRSFETSV